MSAASNMLMVGAPSLSDSTRAGAVFVFTLSSRNRTQLSYQVRLQAPTPSLNDKFGRAIVLGQDAAFIAAGSG